MGSHVKIGPRVLILEHLKIYHFVKKKEISCISEIGTRGPILTCETIFPLKIEFPESL